MMDTDFRQCYMQGEGIGMRYALAIPRDTGASGAGTRLGNKAGRSIDFRDYRDYHPGDDPRWIDWNIFGRTDRLTVKLYHEEVSPHLDILADVSRSMDLPGTAKAEALLQTAAMFAVAAANAGCSCSCWTLGDQVRRLGSDRGSPQAWEPVTFSSTAGADVRATLSAPRLRRNGIRILLSDLMWEGDPLPVVRRLSDQASALTVIQILAHDEISPPTYGNTRLVDVETGAGMELFVDGSVREQYTNALEQHREYWEHACRSAGSRFMSVDAEQIAASPDAGEFCQAGIVEAIR